ncbi:MAG: endo-1,4-beta-xylanase [Planctomycetes bacterium]|nr:endo-1,4-beta-xylanase [Planctomycetota bacterium]
MLSGQDLTVNNRYSTKSQIPQGRRLRDIIAEKFPEGKFHMGVATMWYRHVHIGDIVDTEYNHVTPENDFKQSAIHPKPGVWNWKMADAWVANCKKVGQSLRIHGPISPQCSRWVKEDSRTPEELEQVLRDYLSKLFQRYDKEAHVKWFDVINEVTHMGKWKKPEKGVDKWETPWEILGYDTSTDFHIPKYIIIAFEIANKYAPNSQLIINQHSFHPTDWGIIKKLIHHLRNRGLRVDGIGWQAHVDTGWEEKPQNLKQLSELIDWAHSNDLSFHITEINAWIKSEKEYQAQAKTFAAILEMLLRKRGRGDDSISYNLWNVSDNFAWMKEKMGTIFDKSMLAKPAYYELQKVLENPPPKDPPVKVKRAAKRVRN